MIDCSARRRGQQKLAMQEIEACSYIGCCVRVARARWTPDHEKPYVFKTTMLVPAFHLSDADVAVAAVHS